MALHALSQAKDPTIFKGIVFAGVPFQGCINVLSPLRYVPRFPYLPTHSILLN